jgi:hypothetical protein
MNKYKQLMARLMKVGIIAAAVVALFAGLYVGVSMYADSVSADRKKYENEYTRDRGLLADLRSQMDKSGEAEKRYLAIQADRTNPDLAATMDGPGGLNEFLRDAKMRYHFDKLTIKPVKEVATDKSELVNFPFNILLRPHLIIQFSAVSDVHVFSFIDDLRRAAPGFVRIDRVEMKRNADITDAAITQMQSGQSPILVNATIEFTWIRITPKDVKAAAPDATVAGAPR